MQSSKGRSSASVVKATAWAKANPHEWDFSKVKPKERSMAVAWEYGRECFDQFLRYSPFLWQRDTKKHKKTKKPAPKLEDILKRLEGQPTKKQKIEENI